MRATLSAVGTCCTKWVFLLLNNKPAVGDVTAVREDVTAMREDGQGWGLPGLLTCMLVYHAAGRI